MENLKEILLIQNEILKLDKKKSKLTDREILLHQNLKKNVGKKLCELFIGVPHHLLTYDICYQRIALRPTHYKLLPEWFKSNDKLIELAIKMRGDNLLYIEPEKCSEKLYNLAIQNNGKSIRYIPKHILTYKMCLKAVEVTPEAIRYTPNKFINYKLLKAVIKSHTIINKNANYINYAKIDNIVLLIEAKLQTKKFITYSMYRKIIKLDPCYIMNVPTNYLSKKMIYKSISKLVKFEKNLSAFDNKVETIIGTTLEYLCNLNLSLYIKIIYKLLYNCAKTKFYLKHVPIHMLNEKMCMIALSSKQQTIQLPFIHTINIFNPPLNNSLFWIELLSSESTNFCLMPIGCMDIKYLTKDFLLAIIFANNSKLEQILTLKLNIGSFYGKSNYGHNCELFCNLIDDEFILEALNFEPLSMSQYIPKEFMSDKIKKFIDGQMVFK